MFRHPLSPQWLQKSTKDRNLYSSRLPCFHKSFYRQTMQDDRSSEFELSTLLGEGSFGVVYKGSHLASQAVVAIKIIPKMSNDDDESDKIKSEIDILSRCDSPYIVGYFECFNKAAISKKQGEMWIVMEYCVGGSMSDLLGVRGIPEECIRAIAEIGRAHV